MPPKGFPAFTVLPGRFRIRPVPLLHALGLTSSSAHDPAHDRRWDTSKLRPKGARLKTFGGRASGPEPLESLFLFAVQMFQHARGRKLTPVEAHDLTCKVRAGVRLHIPCSRWP